MATCTFSPLDSTQTVIATFTLDIYILDVTLEGSGTGTVTSNPFGIDCGVDCDELYDYGTVVTLTAVPDPEFKFNSWSGACSGTENTCDVTVDQALSVGAKFDNSFPWIMFLPTLVNQGEK